MDDYLGYQSASQIRRKNKQAQVFSGVENVGYSRIKRTPKPLGRVRNFAHGAARSGVELAKQGWGHMMNIGGNIAANPEVFDIPRPMRPAVGRNKKGKYRPPRNEYTIESLI